MTIDCVDSAGDSADVYDDDDVRGSLYTSEWNGRDIDLAYGTPQLISHIAQFYSTALQEMQSLGNVKVGCRRYEALDLKREIAREDDCFFERLEKTDFRFAVYHPNDREFALANPAIDKAKIEQCKSIFKRIAEKAEKLAKKLAHGVKDIGKGIAHGAEKVASGVADIFKREADLLSEAPKYVQEATRIEKKAVDGVLHGVKKGAEEVAHFVKDHRKEILIATAIVVAVVVGAYFLAPMIAAGANGAATAAASGIAAAGAAAAGSMQRKREGDPDSDSPSASDPPDPFDLQNNHLGLESFLSKEQCEELIHPIATYLRNNPIPISNSSGQFTIPPELEILVNKAVSELGKKPFFTPPFNTAPGTPALNPVPSTQGATPILDAFALARAYIGEVMSSPLCNSGFGYGTPQLPPLLFPNDPEHIKSCQIRTEGMKKHGMGVFLTNGMNTSYAENEQHLNHIKKSAGDLSIGGVYNHSNGALVDVGEIFFLNFQGHAPITTDLILANWIEFHEANKDNPHAKCLQFAHSMGAILTRVALEKAPKEIRDRVIVVAIAPATVIPEGLCYDSHHYVSKNDLVHLAENMYTLTIADLNGGPIKNALIEQLIENKKRITFLEPHPDVKGMDHDFESPTFIAIIEKHIIEYLHKQGQYR